jgi:hypothetical protein
MTRFRRTNRTEESRALQTARKALRRTRRTSALADAAGLARPEFETLEQRQLLFTLTITPDLVNPFTGVGTVTAFFGYVVPYIIPTTDPQATEGTTVTEDFNTDDPGAPGLAGIPIPNNHIFEGSGLRHTHGPLTSVRLTAAGGTTSDNFLRYTFQAGDTFTYSFASDQNPLLNLAVASLSMDISGGFNPNATVVELLLRGEVIATFTGAALNALGVPATGPVRNFTFTAPGTTPFNAVFDAIRFTSVAGAPSTTFDVDNVQWTTPSTFAANLVEERSRYGAQIVFTGPAGASVQIFDLYGRPMLQTIQLPTPEGAEVPLVDPNGDGIPDFNDGIGRIEIRGTNNRSAFTMFGGEIVNLPSDNLDFAEGSFGFRLTDSILGLFDQWESFGFGYNITIPPGGQPTVTGLPPGPGSVVIGSPYVRSLANYNPGGAAASSPVTSGFSRPDQGIKVMDGSAISSVYVHGLIFGSSKFTTIDKYVVGSQMGSISVDGDAGVVMIGSDAGMWMDDDGTPVVSSQAELYVGRTLGEFVSAGRNLMHITVVGDLNNPSLRPPRDVLRHFEREFVPNFNDPRFPPPPDQFTEQTWIRRQMQGNIGPALDRVNVEFNLFFDRFTQALIFGDTNYRNDTLLSAEWVGSIAPSVQIIGQLGFGRNPDPINTAGDGSDVFGFAVDGTQDIVVELDTSIVLTNNMLVRIVDHNGRTVATPQLSRAFRDFVVLRYRPDGPGVYYVVVQAAQSGTTFIDFPYNLTVSGMAPTTFGSYRTGGGSGRNPRNDFANGTNTITVLGGSMGSIRVGTGYASGAGGEADPSAVFNTPTTTVNPLDDEIDEWLEFRASTISVAGTLYNITTGSDIQGGNLFNEVTINVVGGNFGTLLTGRSELAGVNVREGDLRFFRMTVGGAIAMVDVQGAIGANQDIENPTTGIATDPPNTVTFITGTNPLLRGDIGVFRVGSYISGPALTIQTSNGSTIGALLISQDLPFAPGGGAIQGIWDGQINLQTGFNSDVRFFDTPFITRANVFDHSIPIIANAPPLLFTDDGGAQFSVRIIGGNANAGGLIRTQPGSQTSLGQVFGRFEVNLEGGARLQITSSGNPNQNHITTIGRIIVTGSDAGSSIGIDGTTQVDVWKIEQQGGDEFNEIVNITPMGDIVAIDMVQLNRLEIRSGDLGRTQMPVWSPKLLGPFIGVEVGDTTGGEVGGPIPVPANALQNRELGLYRPLNNSNIGVAFLDDVGSPVDPYLNGLIVRDGDITLVQVGGAVGDVIAADGDIVQVFANFDRTTPAGRFDGIIGSIYANRISLVNIGDGLAAPDPSPLSTTGIFANDDILRVVGDIAGSFLSGRIVAANNVLGNQTPQTFPTGGIEVVELTGGGSYIDAYIASENLDAFWTAFFPPDIARYAGNVNRVLGADANFFRSTVSAFDVNLFRMTRGYFDASTLNVGGNLGTAEATGFRNTTVDGQELEFRISEIIVGGNAQLITTTNRAGDISDLTVDVDGVLNEISALNFSRTTIDADHRLVLVRAVESFRGSAIRTGRLVNMDVGDSIRSSSITVAGPLERIFAVNEITNTDISVTGPDGRIDRITTRLRLTGRITSAGPIDTIEVTEGDMVATIVTVTNLRGIPGDIRLLRAGRDLDLTTDISGTVQRFEAGRHLGNQFTPRVIHIKGDVQTISIPNGQLYADIRMGGGLTEGASIGTAFHRPGGSNLGTGSIIAFGRIERIDINGDFGARIYSYSGGIGVITINNGSLLPSAEVLAFDGTLQNIFINNGNLYGRVHADYNILAIRLNGSEDGVFGDIGVNPAFNPGTPYSEFRNQLPPNVIANAGVQGPRITAGFNIGRIILTNGSIFESFIHAGRAIGTIDVTGSIQNDNQTVGIGTVIAAGSSIFLVRTAGNIENTVIIAGVRNFGADNALGGTGANADVVQSGRIETIRADGNMVNVAVSAGMNAGPDGMYNTGDETVALGISFVRSVTAGGSVNNVSVFADSPTLTVSPGVVRAGTDRPIADPDIASGVPSPSDQAIPGDGSAFAFTWGGASGTIRFTTDKGGAFWDPATGQITLVNTSLNSQLIVGADNTLANFRIVSNDDASMGLVQVDTNLAGDSRIVIDAYVLRIQTQDVLDAGQIRVGMNVREINTGHFTGQIEAAFWARNITINGNFGTPAEFGEARISALAGDTITIGGTNAGLINVIRDLAALNVGGAMDRAQFRVGNSVGPITIGSYLSESRISAGDNIGAVRIGGHMHESTIQAGGDLGEDAAPGGTGLNADAVSTGSIASVVIGGNFTRSSITAGLLRGPDGYFGTQDDVVAPGRSNIGNVTIAGTQVGSSLNTEQYRIAATGSIGTVTARGNPISGQGNFQVRRIATDPLPIRVLDLQTYPQSQTWFAVIYFNQSMNLATIGPALTISERRGANEFIPLVEGVDYTIGSWDPVSNSVQIVFSREVTDRNLPQDPSLPGPGVFRFHLDSEVLRASVATARLDGDSDGFATANENFSEDAIVGDAGDKFEPEIVEITNNLGQTHRVDAYGPVNLDWVLDSNLRPDGLPDPNRTYTIRGAIGDHPDIDVSFFRTASDVDIYRITLQAGQILRLGQMDGSAAFTGRVVANSDFFILGNNTPQAIRLATERFTDLDRTFRDEWLIKQTGVYYIVVGNDFSQTTTPGAVPNVPPSEGTTGDYNFTITVFDDGDSGFAADTNSGNGANLVNAPEPILFAGPNGIFQDPGDPNYDDRTVIHIGEFSFMLDPGPDGIRGTADDRVFGTNSNGITSERFGGTLRTTVESAIGPRGHSGVPGAVAADVDVYHLNSGQPIAPGTRMTITVKLTDLGADLGSFSQLTFTDFRPVVQFGLFDTTGATGIDDAALVFSPTDFRPTGRTPGVIASRGPISYGYDANGDFFITFVTPDRVGGTPGEAGSFAVYLQGAFNTDYTLEVVTHAAAPLTPIPKASQNVVIELNGGVIDWLEAGNLPTRLAPFNAGVLGLTGTINGQPVNNYIINNVITRLNQIFGATGLEVNFATSPIAFEFEPFSTVFVTSSSDPTTQFRSLDFGYSQHSDPFNADKNDQAVVFLPAFATLGYTPAADDVNSLIDSLTAAIGRRVGELLGLRLEAPAGFTANPISIMAANSVGLTPEGGQVYRFTNFQRPLSTPFDQVTGDFYLGQQNAFALLHKFLS